MKIRFYSNCGILDLVQRGTNPLTRRKELGIPRGRKRLALI